MAIQRTPFLTIGMLILLIALQYLVPEKTLLFFSAAEIANGETWRVISGHFIHADTQHLLWNCLGLAVLGTLIELHSRSVLLAALGAGIVAVSVLLLSPIAELEYYCGLSGVLNSLLLVALWLEWMLTRSWPVTVIACACIAKVIIEVSMGTSIVTHISWPPYAWSHVAGLSGGLLVIFTIQFRNNLNKYSINADSINYAPGDRVQELR